jgi:hypothetical protein
MGQVEGVREREGELAVPGLMNGDQGGNNPKANAPRNDQKIDPKSTAFDLLLGQRWRVGGRGPFFAPHPLRGGAWPT